MRNEIALIAGPHGWGDNRASWLAKVPGAVRAALGTTKETVSVRMVKALWYGEYGTDPDHHAARDVRRAAEIIAARAALADKFKALAGGLDAANSTIHSEQIARLEHVARVLCGDSRRG